MLAAVVLATGASAIVEDRGRPGYAHLGVPRAGAFDTRAWRLANRLVGNAEDAAVLECLGGGLDLQAHCHRTWAVTGAVGDVLLGGRRHATNTPLHARPGDRLRLGTPGQGLRYYVAVSGGIGAPAVLGSRSLDTLGRLGPPPLRAGDEVHCGPGGRRHPVVDHVAPAPPATSFPALPGPDGRPGLFEALLDTTWDLDPQSDRVGVRLTGPPLAAPRASLPSRPMVLGAVQLPPNGLPIILGPDHPTTGGYPVIAVVTGRGMCDVAQWAGGIRRFTRARTA